MNWLDIVIIIVIGISTLMGLKTGIIKTVLSLVGVVLGIIVASMFSPALADKLTFVQGSIARIIAFAIIFIAIVVIMAIIANALDWLASKIMLGWLNHLGGAVFGLVMGTLTCAAFLGAWVIFLGPNDTITGSILARQLERFSLVLSLLPGGLGQPFQRG